MDELEMTVEALKRCVEAEAFEKALTQVRGEAGQPRQRAERNKQAIRQLLLEMGFPASLRGYGYCVTAIELLLERPELAGMLTKGLYPLTAQVHGTTAGSVERAIRHGVECAYDRAGREVFSRFFGNSVGGMYGKPTNAEFLMCLTNRAAEKCSAGYSRRA